MKIKKMDYMAALAATALLLPCASCRHASTDEIQTPNYPPPWKNHPPRNCQKYMRIPFLQLNSALSRELHSLSP